MPHCVSTEAVLPDQCGFDGTALTRERRFTVEQDSFVPGIQRTPSSGLRPEPLIFKPYFGRRGGGPGRRRVLGPGGQRAAGGAGRRVGAVRGGGWGAASRAHRAGRAGGLAAEGEALSAWVVAGGRGAIGAHADGLSAAAAVLCGRPWHQGRGGGTWVPAEQQSGGMERREAQLKGEHVQPLSVKRAGGTGGQR